MAKGDATNLIFIVVFITELGPSIYPSLLSALTFILEDDSEETSPRDQVFDPERAEKGEKKKEKNFYIYIYIYRKKERRRNLTLNSLNQASLINLIFIVPFPSVKIFNFVDSEITPQR